MKYCDCEVEIQQLLVWVAGQIGRSYSDRCVEILTELLALKQEHITSGDPTHTHTEVPTSHQSSILLSVLCLMMSSSRIDA